MEMNTMTSLSEIFTELATTITNSSLCMPVSLPQELFSIVITMISLRGCRNEFKKKYMCLSNGKANGIHSI